MNRMLVTALAYLLAGCTFPMTKPVPTGDAAAVAVLNPAFATPGKDRARVTVKRDTGLIASKLAAYVRVDGEPVATLMPAEKVEFYVLPGNYVISAHAGAGNLTGYTAEASVTATLAKPQVLRVRFIAEQPYMLLEPTAF